MYLNLLTYSPAREGFFLFFCVIKLLQTLMHLSVFISLS